MLIRCCSLELVGRSEAYIVFFEKIRDPDIHHDKSDSLFFEFKLNSFRRIIKD